MSNELNELASFSDGDFLRTMAAGTREQIPEEAKNYDDILVMQAMAARMEAIAARLDAADTISHVVR